VLPAQVTPARIFIADDSQRFASDEAVDEEGDAGRGDGCSGRGASEGEGEYGLDPRLHLRSFKRRILRLWRVDEGKGAQSVRPQGFLEDRTGQDRTGQDRTGQDRTGHGHGHGHGQDRTGKDRTGQRAMPVICIGPICVPWAAVWPLLLMVLRPLYECLRPRLRRIDWIRNYIDRWDKEEEENAAKATSNVKKMAEVSEEERDEVNSGEILHIHAEAEFSKRLSVAMTMGIPAVVKFTAPWCKPCKRIQPLYQKLAKEYKGRVLFLEVDHDKLLKLAKRCGAKILPTFQAYKQSKKIENLVGADTDKLTNLVNNLAAPS